MDQRERYFWDLTGYLVVPGVLTAEEIDEANQAIDYIKQWVETGEDGAGARDSSFLQGTGSRWYQGDNLLNLPKPHCEPFRKLLAHPAVGRHFTP